jgi:hypothetical protein
LNLIKAASVITFALHLGDWASSTLTAQISRANLLYIQHNGVCGTEIFNFLSPELCVCARRQRVACSHSNARALEIDISVPFGSQTNSSSVARMKWSERCVLFAAQRGQIVAGK